jgi:methionyl-tRNA synthetase
VVKALCHMMAPFMPEGATRLADILNIDIPDGGPDGGSDAWELAKDQLVPGDPISPPQVLFPKLDPDRIAELAALHSEGKAQM